MIDNEPIFVSNSYKNDASFTWRTKENYKSDIEKVEIVLNQNGSRALKNEVTIRLKLEHNTIIEKHFTLDATKSYLIGFWDPIFEKKGVSINLNEPQGIADRVGSLFNQTLFTISSTNNGCLLRSNYFECTVKPLDS